MPGAGKSSLLGALAQAAQTQENALSGHLGDLSHGLEELQQRLYEGTPRQTLDEIVPYPVTFDVLASSSGGSVHSNAIFVDCDGRAANELLTKRRSLGAEVGDGALAREIMASDTLLFVIDASAAATEIETVFALFSQFLRLLEQCRGRRSDVAGLPIFLVLTKCDLLAQANDTAAEWVDRIEERKCDVTRAVSSFSGQAAGWRTCPVRARASSLPLYGGEASGIGRQATPAPPALRRRGAFSSVFEVGTQLSTAAETVHSPATLDNGRHGGNRCAHGRIRRQPVGQSS